MVEPSQGDFHFDTHRAEDRHNHDADLGTEKRSAVVRDCKIKAREQPFESAGDVIDNAMANLQIDPGVRPVNLKHLARCLQRERAALYPTIDFSDPNYQVNLKALKGTQFRISIFISYQLQFSKHVSTYRWRPYEARAHMGKRWQKACSPRFVYEQTPAFLR